MARIQTLARLLLLPTALFGLLYPLHGIWGTWRYAVGQPELWLRNRWFEAGAEIAMATRLGYALLWSIPAVCGGLAMAMGFACLWLIRRGVLFDPRIARRIRWMGAFVALSATTQTAMMALTPTIISWHNPSGPLAPIWRYDSETIGLMFCGAAFWLIGWILAEAIRIADENAGFI